ncbi:MAG: hypothetical protein WC998_02320 [Candidatus Paceibacterota bacterium]|jgi:hypothetical protein
MNKIIKSIFNFIKQAFLFISLFFIILGVGDVFSCKIFGCNKRAEVGVAASILFFIIYLLIVIVGDIIEIIKNKKIVYKLKEKIDNVAFYVLCFSLFIFFISSQNIYSIYLLTISLMFLLVSKFKKNKIFTIVFLIILTPFCFYFWYYLPHIEQDCHNKYPGVIYDHFKGEAWGENSEGFQKCYYYGDKILPIFFKDSQLNKISVEKQQEYVVYKEDFDGSSLYGRLYRSKYGGGNWKEILKQYKGDIIYDVFHSDSKIIYIGDSKGNTMAEDMDIDLLKSIDAGDNWVDISKGIINQVGSLYGVNSLWVDYKDSNIVDVSVKTQNGEIKNFKSLDGGNTWEQRSIHNIPAGKVGFKKYINENLKYGFFYSDSWTMKDMEDIQSVSLSDGKDRISIYPVSNIELLDRDLSVQGEFDCAADSPTGSITCKSSKVEEYINQNGFKGFKIFRTRTYERYGVSKETYTNDAYFFSIEENMNEAGMFFSIYSDNLEKLEEIVNSFFLI